MSARSSIRRESDVTQRLERVKPFYKSGVNVVVCRAAKCQPERRMRGIGSRDDRVDGIGSVAASDEFTAGDRAAHFARGRMLVHVHGVGAIHCGPEVGASRSRLRDNEVDAERCHLLRNRFDETFNAPLAGVIQTEARIGDLPALGRDLHDPTAALRPQVRKAGPNPLDRAGEIGRELPIDLFVSELFRRAKQAISGVADDDVDSASAQPSVGKIRNPLRIYVPGTFVGKTLAPRRSERLDCG